MTTKDVIDQAENRFSEKFGKDSEMAKFLTLKYGTNIQHLRVEELIKEFIFSTYTKDLLQSVVRELDVLDTCLDGVPIDSMSIINTKFYASDVVKRLKEVKADIISKLK